MNYADSEKVIMLLRQAWCQSVDEWKEADFVIFNTCSVRKKAEDRVYGSVHEIYKYNKHNNTDIKALITGCMTRKTGLNKKYYDYGGRNHTKTITRVVDDAWTLQDEQSIYNSDDQLFNVNDKIDAIFRIEEVWALTTLLSVIFKRDIGQDDKFNGYLQSAQARPENGSANIIIQTGCDNYCTFCIVPYTRGHEVSRPIDEIVDEVKIAVKGGAKEVTLLWQNVNSYGKMQRENLWNPDELTWSSPDVRTPFRELLETLNDIPWLDRIRFTSSNPHDMTKDILDSHTDLGSLCPYLHFALQSWSDEVLKSMNRKHSYSDFKTMVEYLRAQDPFFSISTDIIVGFPWETDEQFDMTVQAFRECQFDFAYIARYSPRDMTYAAKMKNSVSHEEKARRWDILNQELRLSLQARNNLMLGRSEKILITKVHEKCIAGRTRNFKEVFMDYQEWIAASDLIVVKISEVDEWVLKWELS